MQVTTQEELTHPPAALISNNPLQWFRFFGPGAIIASVTIGSGEILFPSRGGAIFGYRVLYIFLFIALLKWVLAYCSMRHLILTGAHPLKRWGYIRGPKGWLPLFMFAIFAFTIPLWYSFLAGLTGLTCAWIFGMGNHYMWATAFVAVAVLLLIVGNYDFLERVQTGILAVKVGCILVAVFYVGPEWLAVAKGLVPRPLEYPDWLFGVLPEMKNRSVWVEVIVYASVIGGQSFDYLAYVSFLRDKKWGRSHLEEANPHQLAQMAAQPNHPARLWLRAALVDTVVSFAMVAILSSAFCILGTVILQPQQRIPEGINLLNYQASFLTTLSPWLLPIYKLAVFSAFFGILYGGPELSYRMTFEYFNTFERWKGRLPLKAIRIAVVSWALGGGLVVLWLSRVFPGVQLIDVITPAGIYSGVLGCGFYCFANPWMDWRFLPRPMRMPGALVILNVLSGIAFTAMGLKALWDYGQVKAFLTLAALILGCILLATCFRFLHRLPAESQQCKPQSTHS
jgi:Mn2+/Fe2+ NRAMP family transporter